MNLSTLAKLNRKLRDVMLVASSNGNEPVSTGHVAVFEDIYKHSPTTVRDITKRTTLAQSYVSKIITQMKHAGVVKLRQSRTDKRTNIITFNPELTEYVQSMGKSSIHDALRAQLPNGNDTKAAQAEALLASLSELFGEQK